jgi:hypothetical protein
VNPIAGPNNKDTCVYVTSSNCVIWNGPDLACINLCKGDTVSDITAKLAEKLCSFIEDNDLNDLDLKCVFDACLGCPEPDKSLKTVLELIINKVCTLQNIINECCAGVDGVIDSSVFDVNLKCLAVQDGSGTILNNDDNNEIIQAIIDRVCSHEARLGSLENKVEDLQDQIDSMDGSGGSIPGVSSACLFSGTKTINEGFVFLDTSFCSFKTAFGTEAQVAQALSQQCSTFYTELVGNINVVVNPTTLAQSVKNLWLLSCNMLARLKSIEENCCKVDCDDIKIGFQVIFNTDETVNLKFSSGAGTNIPTGFVDCGSKLIISDQHGNQTLAESIVIANNALTDDIDIQGLTVGDILSFELTAKLCLPAGSTHGGAALTCERCVYKTVTYTGATDSGCDVCEICATADTGIVTINYINQNTNVPGAMIILPDNCKNVYRYMVVTGVGLSGSTQPANLECLNYPTQNNNENE